jgi:hypothetical protein
LRLNEALAELNAGQPGRAAALLEQLTREAPDYHRDLVERARAAAGR